MPHQHGRPKKAPDMKFDIKEVLAAGDRGGASQSGIG
jgi:hypothetical protein